MDIALIFDVDGSLYMMVAIFFAAILYSSVGHGGASGYLAVMVLFGLAPEQMRPVVLVMNVFVTILVFARLSRSGYFNARLFLPFAISSIPFAFWGGTLKPDDVTYKYFVGIALLVAAWRMLRITETKEADLQPVSWKLALPVGSVLGFIAGLTGVGGGIYLSPLLLMLGWTTMRGSAAISSAFILLNSLAGLGGYAYKGLPWPEHVWLYVIIAMAGGLVGSEIGSHTVNQLTLKKLLGLVLIIAGAKFIWMAWNV